MDATVLVNNNFPENGASVLAGEEVVIQLRSLTGVDSWTCEPLNTSDDSYSASDIKELITKDDSTYTATFTMPEDVATKGIRGIGIEFLVEINGGKINGLTHPNASFRFCIFVETASGFRPAIPNESGSRSRLRGWSELPNQMIAAIENGGGGGDSGGGDDFLSNDPVPFTSLLNFAIDSDAVMIPDASNLRGTILDIGKAINTPSAGRKIAIYIPEDIGCTALNVSPLFNPGSWDTYTSSSPYQIIIQYLGNGVFLSFGKIPNVDIGSAPTLDDAEVNIDGYANQVSATFSEAVYGSSPLGFSVSGIASAPSVSTISGTGATRTIVLTGNVVGTDTPTITIASPRVLQDLDGNRVSLTASFPISILGGFELADLANLSLLIDNLGSQYSGGTITNGVGGGAIQFTQGTAGNRPTYSGSDAAFNNLPTISFDGTNDSCAGNASATVANIFGTGNYYMGAAFSLTSVTTTGQTYTDDALWASAGPWNGWFFNNDGGTYKLKHYQYTGINTFVPAGLTNNIAISANTPHYLEATSDGTNVTIYLDGTQVGQTAGGNLGAGAQTALVNFGVNGANYIGAKLHQMFVVKGTIPASGVMNQVRTYWDNRLGLP